MDDIEPVGPLTRAQQRRLHAITSARRCLDNSTSLRNVYKLPDVMLVAQWIIEGRPATVADLPVGSVIVSPEGIGVTS